MRVPALTFAFTLALAGCAGSRAVQKRPEAALVVDCDVADARVYVDDHFVGRAVELRGQAIEVAAGSRRVEVRADGWFTAYRDVPVARDGRAQVTVSLHRVPVGEPAE
jgi:hypothetical protein